MTENLEEKSTCVCGNPDCQCGDDCKCAEGCECENCKQETAEKKPLFTIREMLEAGVHFGHKTMRLNSKMAPYIYGIRNNLHIIDLTQTAILMNEAMRILREIAKKRGRILFVCTKKQGAELVAKMAENCGQYYVNHKWLGGMLTNWKTISQSIKKIKAIESQLNDPENHLVKKERLKLEKDKEKLELKDSLSDISHQLKTPLTSILIMLDNLIDDPQMDENIREDFIRDIKREINSINFLVQSILKLSKLDTNTVNFIEEKNDLNEIVNQAIKNVTMLSDLKNVSVILKSNTNSIIKCDFKWQVEAISNIIKNCIEHSNKDSEVIITIEDNKAYWKITIKDSGIGIDKEDLPHIFERFYKGKNATPDSIGIGLSLAQTIIKKDNGTISVKSSSKGTTFTIKYFK